MNLADMNRGYDIRLSKLSYLGIGILLATITAFHYFTSPVSIVPHNVFRRLYYLPIVWAAFTGGMRAGLLVAACATLVYLPHAFFMTHHLDPAPNVDKAMEMALYFGMGGLAGFLVDRERQARQREQKQALARTAAEGRAERLSSLVHLSQGLAHEIRNPLGGIQGAIEILSEEVSNDSPRREMVHVGLQETARLNRVLSEFLQFARPGEPVLKSFPPADVVRQLVEIQRPDAEAKEIVLQARINGTVPAAFGDPEQIMQVLLNLVKNAIEATPESGSVEVIVSAQGRRLLFEVADRGKGIPGDLGDSIYDPYVTSREDGTGLGLSISALLVQQNGGTLTHESRPGGGVVVRFDLPTEPGTEEPL